MFSLCIMLSVILNSNPLPSPRIFPKLKRSFYLPEERGNYISKKASLDFQGNAF